MGNRRPLAWSDNSTAGRSRLASIHNLLHRHKADITGSPVSKARPAASSVRAVRAAEANAVRDAFAGLRADANETPLTPRRVVAAISAARALDVPTSLRY